MLVILEMGNLYGALAERQALAMAPLQDANYEMLEGFAEEIRGEDK